MQLCLSTVQKLHPYKYIYTEEEEEMEITKKEFESFIEWLKTEGVKIKVNERWWKRRIYQRLLNDHLMTLENWNDYQENKSNDDNSESLSSQSPCDPILLIGLIVKGNKGALKMIEKVIDTNTHIHLFFDDHTDELVSREVCNRILNHKKG